MGAEFYGQSKYNSKMTNKCKKMGKRVEYSKYFVLIYSLFKEAWNPNERRTEMFNVVRRTFSTRICTIFVKSEKIKI